MGSGLLTERMLSSSYDSTAQLKANTQLEGQPSKTVLSIEVEIKTRQGYSKVRVKTANSALKELEFEFPIAEVSQLEAAIGRELGLSVEQVRTLVHYQVHDRGDTTIQ
jgi:HD-GYP domain-containing protein (c-di-GMP phosphodiesterase class II)